MQTKNKECKREPIRLYCLFQCDKSEKKRREKQTKRSTVANGRADSPSYTAIQLETIQVCLFSRENVQDLKRLNIVEFINIFQRQIMVNIVRLDTSKPINGS